MNRTEEADTVKANNPPQIAGRPPISAAYSYYALIVLSLLNLLNYVDRSIFSVLMPYIKDEYHYTDEQLGFITGAFTIVYTVLSPVYGYFADRRAPTRLYLQSGLSKCF